MVLASFLASWSFGLNVWPFFPVCTLASFANTKAKIQIGNETKHWGQKTKRPKKRGQKTKRPKKRGQKTKIIGQNERPKWHFKYTQYNATGKKTCPSLSEASDRLSVPYQLSLFTHPDANDRLSVTHQLSLFTQPRIPEELSLQAKISNLGWCKFIESIKFSLCCINIFLPILWHFSLIFSCPSSSIPT